MDSYSLFIFLDGTDPLAEALGCSGGVANLAGVKLGVGGVSGSYLSNEGLGDVVLRERDKGKWIPSIHLKCYCAFLM